MRLALCAAAAALVAACGASPYPDDYWTEAPPWPPVEPPDSGGGGGSKATCRRDSYLVGFSDEYFRHRCRDLSNPDVCPERCHWKNSCAELDAGGIRNQVYVQGYWPNSVPPVSCCANAALQTHSCRWRDWYAEDELYHDEVIADVALRFKEPSGGPIYTQRSLRKKTKERLQRRLQKKNVRPRLASRRRMRVVSKRQAKKEGRRRCVKKRQPQRCVRSYVARRMKKRCARGKAGKKCRRAKAKRACQTSNCMRRARRQRKLRALKRNNPRKAKQVHEYLAQRKRARRMQTRQNRRDTQRSLKRCKRQRSTRGRKACARKTRKAKKRMRVNTDKFEDDTDNEINVKFCMDTQQRGGNAKPRNMCKRTRGETDFFPAPTEGYLVDYTEDPYDYYTEYPETYPGSGNENGNGGYGFTDYPPVDGYSYDYSTIDYGTWGPPGPTYAPPTTGNKQEQRVNIRVRVCKVALNDNCRPGTGYPPTGPGGTGGTGGGGGATEIVIRINVTTRSDKQWLRESVEQGNVQIVDGESGIYAPDRCGEQEYRSKYRMGCELVQRKLRKGGK